MSRPNVLVVLVDDMGYSDIGCYGGEIRTPAIDRLAREGTRFSQFYNTARCSRSRASLITGLHPHQTGIGVLTNDDRPRGYPGTINKRCVTIAEVLKAAGYATCLAGKWHLLVERVPDRALAHVASDSDGAGRDRSLRTAVRNAARSDGRGVGDLDDSGRAADVPRPAIHRARSDDGRGEIVAGNAPATKKPAGWRASRKR